ncbi:MAG TPA: PGPGW domain-containing protein [Mycobacteriales bacterium]|nr:PGPGW domain-containing protein [Mycobacteriales bacterium]
MDAGTAPVLSAEASPRPAATALRTVWGLLRKVAVLIAGSVVILAGIAMLVLPGPGWITIFAGLALLAREFPWAARLLQASKRVAARLWARVRSVLPGRSATRRPGTPTEG